MTYSTFIVISLLSVFTTLFCYFILTYLKGDLSIYPGHLKPLSYQGPRDDSPAILEYTIPQANEFYEKFVKTSTPVVLKDIVNRLRKTYSAFTRWTDNYLVEKYGDVIVEVERGKKENRLEALRYMTLRDFIEAYVSNDLYMVHNVPEIMEHEVLVFGTLLCGGFEKVITEAVIWFSSGGTASLLHNDNLDNINCLLDGQKDVLLFNKSHNEAIESHGFLLETGQSSVDVDSVDLNTFPQFAGLPWKRMHIEAGDCFYIPHKMFHQVNTAQRRSIAVNIWFAHLWWFNHSSCTANPQNHQPLSEVDFASPNEQFRSAFLGPFSHLHNITRAQFNIHLLSAAEQLKIFGHIDADNDRVLTWPELYSMDITWLLTHYPQLAQPSAQSTDVQDDDEL